MFSNSSLIENRKIIVVVFLVLLMNSVSIVVIDIRVSMEKGELDLVSVNVLCANGVTFVIMVVVNIHLS